MISLVILFTIIWFATALAAKGQSEVRGNTGSIFVCLIIGLLLTPIIQALMQLNLHLWMSFLGSLGFKKTSAVVGSLGPGMLRVGPLFVGLGLGVFLVWCIRHFGGSGDKA
jgi:hypothetical protein